MMKAGSHFRRRLIISTGYDTRGIARLSAYSQGRFPGISEERFEQYRDESLADYRMGKRPPWKVQGTEHS